MGLLNNMLRRLFFPRIHHFNRGWTDLMELTCEQVSVTCGADKTLCDILITWLVVAPEDYFEALFMTPNQWNDRLINLFDGARNLDGKECAAITQGFMLSIFEGSPLFQLHVGNPSASESVTMLLRNLGDRSRLSGELTLFRHLHKSDRTLEDPVCNRAYIMRILQSLYQNEDYARDVGFAILGSPKLSLSLGVYTTELLVSLARATKMSLNSEVPRP